MKKYKFPKAKRNFWKSLKDFWKNLKDGIKVIRRIAHLEVALDEIRKYYRIIDSPDFKFSQVDKELIATVNAESYQLLQVLQTEERK